MQRGLSELKQGLIAAQRGVSRARDVMRQWTRLQDVVGHEWRPKRPQHETADQLLNMSDDLVCRGGNHRTARIH